MAVRVEINNPEDRTTTYDQIVIQRSTTNTVAGMATIATVSIDLTYSSDLSSGYTAYLDADGDVDTHYYRFQYKLASSGAVSSFSDIFQAGTTVLHTRFRRMMRDVNSNTYFFLNTDIDFFLQESVDGLWPTTWFETYDDSSFVPDGTTEIFSFPNGVTRISGIDILNDQGEKITSASGWSVRNRTLLFDNPIASGYTIRAWVEKKFTKLSECPSVWHAHILNKMRLRAYEMLEADRTTYYKYTTVTSPEGGNLPSIDKVITRLENQIRLREGQLKRVRKPTSIKLT